MTAPLVTSRFKALFRLPFSSGCDTFPVFGNDVKSFLDIGLPVTGDVTAFALPAKSHFAVKIVESSRNTEGILSE